MGATYTTGRDRDRRRSRFGAPDGRGERLLILTVFVSTLAIAICYSGRLRAFETTETTDAAAVVVNLSRIENAADLEPVMARAFEAPGDRRLAARELWNAVLVEGDRVSLPNVGALARVAVPLSTLEEAAPGSVYAARLGSIRERAANNGVPPPATTGLFTASDVARLKPGLLVRTRQEHRTIVFWCAVALIAAYLLVSLAWRLRHMTGDRVLLSAALLLTTLGFLVMLSRPDPLRDTLLIVRYTQGVVAALALFLIASMVDVRRASHLGFSYLPLAGALLLSTALIVFGSGPGTSGVRINLGPFQPIEAIRLLLVLFLSGYFARRWEVIRQLRSTGLPGRPLPAWLNLPRLDLVLPVMTGVIVALVLFFALKDLGPALLLSLIFLAMFAVARAGVGMAAAGLATLFAGFYLGHTLGISSTLTERVAMWQSPWENAVRGGDQIAQAMWSMASGGMGGTGLGLGAARYLPAGHTDLVLASIGEELGGIGILAAGAAFAVMAWRGFRIGRSASTDYGFFLAIGMTLSLVVPLVVMAAGVLGVIPLTGVVTPFLSYGGSAMVANFLALGLLAACGRDAAGSGRTEPFRIPVRWLGGTLAASAIVLLVVWMQVQVVQADEFLVRPQLSRQADGGLRYQYNPRVLDVVGLMPRGSVFDRGGIPLATDDPATVLGAAGVYDRMGIRVAEVCGSSGERCYPLGGEAFHLLGDARSRVNWSASNTSYVERDAEARLRGFEDHAMTVTARPGSKEETLAVRRDYAALVPLVRHRWTPDHPEVKALVDQPRDVRLTIDARLQHEVASILSRAVHAAKVEKGAAVVLDAATGEVLASVSYPWPETSLQARADEAAALDRARYGLYPPGSTFKVVTAAAALRIDPALAGLSMVCTRLPDNRVGTRLPGTSRPVRDDVLDRQPHGAIEMHEGLVRSCNAYFAQLAVRIGPDALAGTAGLAGIALSPSNDPARGRENLPHAGYGQGQVVTTPLRMARVAAAIASDGVIRDAPLVADSAPTSETTFLSAESARTLGGFMRDAVTDGTGRVLARHDARIAGKTGTAEIDNARSHAWFVGFAPHGQATRRIAFAVILENAGYGGASAASVSGRIVTAAASLGLVP